MTRRKKIASGLNQHGGVRSNFDLDRIRRLATEYEDDPSVPDLTMEQAFAVLAIMGSSPTASESSIRALTGLSQTARQ